MTAETTIALSVPRWSAQTASASGAAAQHLVCRVGRQLHAIPIEHVIEIMRALTIEPIAGAPDYVRGACIMRGAPVPVVDLGLLVGKQQTPGGRLVAIKAGNRTIALLVDEVIGIRSFNAAVFNELPPLLRDVASETVAGIGALDSEMLLMLRVARIVPEDVLSDLETAGP